MKKIVVDRQLQSQLSTADFPTEICDDGGALIGYFLPEDEFIRLMYASANYKFTDEEREEWRRELREQGGLTTEQVLDHLRNVVRQCAADNA